MLMLSWHFGRQPSSLVLFLVAYTLISGKEAAAFSVSDGILAQRRSSFVKPSSRTHCSPSREGFTVRNERLTTIQLHLFSEHERQESKRLSSFDPLNIGSDQTWADLSFDALDANNAGPVAAAFATLAALPLLLPDDAAAAMSPLSTGDFDPSTFKPVCPASDGFYRFLQGSTQAVVGDDNFVEYGPLIAGGLLRVRLELCVVESFFNEAVGPFIQQNGLSWILPLHETVETFLAGTVFALATTFILVGSTKLISVIATYGDVFVGAPCRLFGGFAFDRARGKPVTLDIGFGPFKTRVIGPPEEVKGDGLGSEGEGKIIDLENVGATGIVIILASGAVKYAGEASRIVREFIDALDLFVGRYLVLLATGYIGLKFIHFKIFPDFPPF